MSGQLARRGSWWASWGGIAGTGELGLAGRGGGEQLEPAANLLLHQFQLAEGTAQQGVDS